MGLTNLRYLSILDELRYFPTSSVCNQLLRESVEESLAHIGKSYSKALLNNMCSLYGLSESELLTNYDLFETTLYKVLGPAGQSVITRIKKEMLLRAVMSNSEITVNDILNPALTVNYVLKKLQYVELFEFLNGLHGGEHIALLYTDEVPKNKILCEFFRSSMEDQQGRHRGRNPIGLVSVKPTKDKDMIFNIPYKELLDYSRKFDVKERLAKWITYVHSFNVSKNSIPTKIAEEDASLWLKSGFSADEDLRLEQMFSTFTCDHNLSILCAYDISKIDGADIRSMMKSIISAHDYVILDEPLVVYYRARTSMKANNRTCSGSNNDINKTISIPKEH